ncbi:MAG: DUF3109 family protein [Bacteroidota bacterium]
MLIIQDILVSDDVIEQQFLCQLDACKGACCWEGDFGAPLEDSELHTLNRIYEEVKPFLTEAGRVHIEEHGTYQYFKEDQSHGTPLLENGACAYMTIDKSGIAQCGIEQAHKAGATDYLKPISCQLYPIRVTADESANFEALNYDKWDICQAACNSGRKAQLPVYRFVKQAIIRKYGEAFYEELDAAARHLADQRN